MNMVTPTESELDAKVSAALAGKDASTLQYHYENRGEPVALTDEQRQDAREAARQIARDLKIEEQAQARREQKKIEYHRPATPFRYCALNNCERVVTVQSTNFCEPHRKKWNQFQKAGFSIERFIEFEMKPYCDCCGDRLGKRNVGHDHNHCASSKWCNTCARGVVCNRCNLLLTAVDDKQFLANAEAYIKRYQNGSN